MKPPSEPAVEEVIRRANGSKEALELARIQLAVGPHPRADIDREGRHLADGIGHVLRSQTAGQEYGHCPYFIIIDAGAGAKTPAVLKK